VWTSVTTSEHPLFMVCEIAFDNLSSDYHIHSLAFTLYISSISWAYFCSVTFLLSFMVGVSSEPPIPPIKLKSYGSRVNFLM